MRQEDASDEKDRQQQQLARLYSHFSSLQLSLSLFLFQHMTSYADNLLHYHSVISSLQCDDDDDDDDDSV